MLLIIVCEVYTFDMQRDWYYIDKEETYDWSIQFNNYLWGNTSEFNGQTYKYDYSHVHNLFEGNIIRLGPLKNTEKSFSG